MQALKDVGQPVAMKKESRALFRALTNAMDSFNKYEVE